MDKVKFISFWHYFIFVMLIIFIVGYYLYIDRLEKLCTNTKLLSEISLGSTSRLKQSKVFYVDTRNLSNLIDENQVVDLREMREGLWSVNVPEPEKMLTKRRFFVTELSNSTSADYYSYIIDYHLWMSRLVPETLWGSYRDAIEYSKTVTSASCSGMSANQLADIINLFSASTGDLFNIAAERTNYYIDENGRNIIIIHEIRIRGDVDKDKRYYQGYLKAERGEKLVNLSVQNNDFQKVYVSLLKSSLSIIN